MQQRIYIVGHGQEVRLIRAAHKAQALAHVARSIINVKVASQDELVKGLTSGVAIETARAAEQLAIDLGDSNA